MNIIKIVNDIDNNTMMTSIIIIKTTKIIKIIGNIWINM